MFIYVKTQDSGWRSNTAKIQKIPCGVFFFSRKSVLLLLFYFCIVFNLCLQFSYCNSTYTYVMVAQMRIRCNRWHPLEEFWCDLSLTLLPEISFLATIKTKETIFVRSLTNSVWWAKKNNYTLHLLLINKDVKVGVQRISIRNPWRRGSA